MLYQSHIYKIRVEKPEKMTPFLLLAALTCRFAQRQIKSFCVSQDIIDSLGNKIHEIRLALPKAKKTRDRIATLVEKAIRDRTELVSLREKPVRKSWRADFTRRNQGFVVSRYSQQQFTRFSQREVALYPVSVFGDPGNVRRCVAELVSLSGFQRIQMPTW